jgi:hypothetical protein
MIKWNSARPLLEYEVRVGHMRVIVNGISRDDAITNARRRLSREMPRMWDVIHGLAATSFDVTCQTGDE